VAPVRGEVRRVNCAGLKRWQANQNARWVGFATDLDQAPAGAACQRGAVGREWLHEIKYDGYRLYARLDGGNAKR
jgi:ATP-dependent DNA ligase